MEDRGFLRLGAGAGLVGAVLGLVFNILHPRPDGFTVQDEIAMVADNDIWLFDHFMLAWSLAFAFLGLIAIALSMTARDNPAWGRAALASGIGGVVVAFLTVSVDGMALNEAAAAGGPVAEAVAYISTALFTATIGSLFGLTPVIYGLAILNTDAYPRWTGSAAVLIGLLGLLAASVQYLGGVSTLTVILFTIASIGFTLWAIAVNWMLWQRTAAPVGAATTTP